MENGTRRCLPAAVSLAALLLVPSATAQVDVSFLGPTGPSARALLSWTGGDVALVNGRVSISLGQSWLAISAAPVSPVTRIEVTDLGVVYGTTLSGAIIQADATGKWIPTGLSSFAAGNALDPRTLLALESEGGSFLIGGANGLYLAEREGQAATLLRRGAVMRVRRLGPSGLLAVELEGRQSLIASDPQTLALAQTVPVADVQSSCDVLLVGRKGSSIVESVDQGISWRESGILLPPDLPATSLSVGCSETGGIELLVVQVMGRVFCWEQGEWKSSLDIGPNLYPVATAGQHQSWLVSSRRGLFRTSRKEQRWEEANAGLAGPDVTKLALSRSGTLWAAGPQSVWRRERGEWITEEEGLPDPFEPYVWTSLASGSAGHMFLGPSVLEWQGDGWKSISNRPTFFESCGVNGEVLVGTPGVGVIRSTDGGRTWTDTGLDPLPGPPQITLLKQTSNASSIVAASSQREVYLSRDCGSNFVRLPPIRAGGPFTIVSATAMHAATGDAVLVSTTYEGVFQLSEGVWTRVIPRATDAPILATDGERPSIGYAGAGEILLKTADAGKTWREVARLPEGAYVRALVASGANLFAATNSGVYSVAQAAPLITSANLVRSANGLVLLLQGSGFQSNSVIHLDDGVIDSVVSVAQSAIVLRVHGNLRRMTTVTVTNPNLESSSMRIRFEP